MTVKTGLPSKSAQIFVQIEGGALNELTTFDLPVLGANEIFGSSITYGVAKALKEQLDEIDDPAWKTHIREWLFSSAPSGETGSQEKSGGDAVHSPNYYRLPNGAETVDISEWLTSAGGQAVQYIVRATRTDGVVKEDPVQDLEKSRYWVDREIARLSR